MERTILHSDMNCFYASVEMLHHPELAGKPLAVGGDPEARHGIVLTANYIAKKSGVKKQEWHYGRQSRFARKLFLCHQEWICICDFQEWHRKSIVNIQI